VKKGVGRMSPLIVKDTGKYGRGVFTTTDIKKNEIIEKCPVIVVPKDEWKYMKKTILFHYCYFWGDTKDTAVVLGYGFLYNHSYKPNINSKCNKKNLTMDFYALRDIQEGEELTINYHGDLDNQSPLWFDVID